MSQDLNPYSSDRVLVIQDERERIIAFEDFQLVPPSVGIFDEPTRCYRINHQWAKLMSGAVSILLEIGVWKYAEHEGYSAIQQVSDFLDGLECPPDMIVEDVRVNGCNIEALIDGVWVNKGSVLSCVTGITNPMQTQINTNQSNIATNAQNIANNQAAITTNANNISQNATDIDALELDATQQALTINQLQTDVATAQGTADYAVSLINNSVNPYLIDHESRITALENASGGGSGGSGTNTEVSTMSYPFAKFSSGNVYWEDLGWTHTHQFTYSKALIFIHLVIDDVTVDRLTQVRMSLNGIPSSNITELRTTTPQGCMVTSTFTGIDTTVPLDVTLQWYVNGTGNVKTDDSIVVTIIEIEEIITTTDTVTFDTPSLPYVLPVGQIGSVAAGGNPSDCLVSPSFVNNGEYIEVQFTTPSGAQESITDVQFDFLSDNFYTQCEVYIDDVQIGTPIGTQGLNTSTWYTRNWAVDQPSEFPVLGTNIRVRFKKVSGTFYDMRLDNLKAVTA